VRVIHACAGNSQQKERAMKKDKNDPKKKGTLRPWLVDVPVEHLR
jgi:hypothetical protein